MTWHGAERKRQWKATGQYRLTFPSLPSLPSPLSSSRRGSLLSSRCTSST